MPGAPWYGFILDLVLDLYWTMDLYTLVLAALWLHHLLRRSCRLIFPSAAVGNPPQDRYICHRREALTQC